MLKISNNNIYLTRGEVCALDIKSWNMDGTPFVLPPVPKKAFRAIITMASDDNKNTYSFLLPYKTDRDMSLRIVTNAAGQVYLLVKSASGSQELLKFDTDGVLDVTTDFTEIISVITYDCAIMQFDYITPGFTDSYFADLDGILISVLALTVRAADTAGVVLEKYLNLHSNIMIDGKSDYTQYGWNKFTTQDIFEADDLDTLYNTLYNNMLVGIVQIGKFEDNYYHIIRLKDGTYRLVQYEFGLSIPILFEDTANLLNNEYVYDVIVYQGYLKDASNFDKEEFPFDKVMWKKELISPHKLTLGDSNNA